MPKVEPHSHPVPSHGHVEYLPVHLYAESKAAVSGVGYAVPNYYTSCGVTLTKGMWLVQTQLFLVQAMNFDACWVGVALDGAGLLSQSAGAATGLNLNEYAQVVSAMTLFAAGGGEILYPMWWVNGNSRCNVVTAAAGPSGAISAIRLAG